MSGSRIALALTLTGEESSLPPMLQSYLEFKRVYPDYLILFQVGDFYEIFFEDAVTASRVLNITLTSRDKASLDPIPMCGVPVGACDVYSERLVSAGFSVALVSQKEVGPSHKGPVPRALERVITPGVRILGAESSPEAAQPVIAAVVPANDEFGIISTVVQSARAESKECIGSAALVRELLRIGPSEIIIPSEIDGVNFDKRTSWIREVAERLPSAKIRFRTPRIEDTGLASTTGYSGLGLACKKALRLISQYIDEVTVETGFRFSKIQNNSNEKTRVVIDASTRDNLELVKELRGGAKGASLWGVLDSAKTLGGSRCIRSWIISPCGVKEDIAERLIAVRVLKKSAAQLDAIRNNLSYIPDLERIATRAELRVVSPSELASLRDALVALPEIKHIVEQIGSKSKMLSELGGKLTFPEELLYLLKTSLADSPTNLFTEGEVIRDGFNPELDRLREIRKHGRDWIAALEVKERSETGISSLKLRYNQGFGFFIEISKANLHKVPAHYRRKQTTVNGERFTTDELSQREHEIRSAESSELRKQKEIFSSVREQILLFSPAIRDLGDNLSCLDAITSFADIALQRGYVEPEIVEDSILCIDAGKHPALSLSLEGAFVPNDINLSGEDSRCLIVTGANMGGKSTYLRQAALITIMAHAGSFVPAKSAKIGIVDQVFARIGASDNPSEGDSTFMVEMREVSHILKNATSKSLLLIDEVGRGTATTDGLAIARATLESIIVSIKCRTFFATHFHELTDLEDSYDGVVNASVGSVIEDGALVFTHRIEKGPANRSYGLEVARRAGVPEETLKRAAILLDAILKSREDNPCNSSQLPLFTTSPTPIVPKEDTKTSLTLERIKALNVDEMTPLEALNILSTLRTSVLK